MPVALTRMPDGRILVEVREVVEGQGRRQYLEVTEEGLRELGRAVVGRAEAPPAPGAG